MDDDDPLSQILAHDRVSIPAILIVDGDDSVASPVDAGIYDPVTIPVTIGDDSTVMLGDCFTESITAVFTPDDDGMDDLDDAWPDRHDPMAGNPNGNP
jgi:hypothetical protein